MQYRTLGKTGLRVSVLGFGAATLGDVYGAVAPQDGAWAVHRAIELGVNVFDTSPYYGLTLSEQRLGEALQGRRDRVVLITKCGRYGQTDFDFSAARVTASIDESLARLRTDHVDILLAHDVEFGDRRRIAEETIPALRKIQQSGKTRFIGISGLPPAVLREVAQSVEVDVVLSYSRYNLMADDLDRELTPFAQETGIGLINASPLHLGILTEEGPPQWHLAPQRVKDAGRDVVELLRSSGAAVTPFALRFCLEHPYVGTTLVGIRSAAELEQNLKALETPLDPELLARVAAIVAPVKNLTWG